MWWANVSVFVQGWKRVLAGVHGLHDQPRNRKREVERRDRERLPCSQRREQTLRHQGRIIPGTRPHCICVLIDSLCLKLNTILTFFCLSTELDQGTSRLLHFPHEALLGQQGPRNPVGIRLRGIHPLVIRQLIPPCLPVTNRDAFSLSRDHTTKLHGSEWRILYSTQYSNICILLSILTLHIYLTLPLASLTIAVVVDLSVFYCGCF